MSENKKNRSSVETIRLGLVLALYAMVSCAVLAVVSNLTGPKISQNQIDKANAAMKAVVPEAESFEQIQDFAQGENKSIAIEKMYLAKKGEKVIGGTAQVSGPTYDRGTIIVGMTVDGTVTGLQFLELTDSPGFGLKANDPTFTLPNGQTFYGQFNGKNAEQGFKAGVNFDAISGATITSNAIADMISCGTLSMLKYFRGHDYE